jgi:hypothetical protein
VHQLRIARPAARAAPAQRLLRKRQNTQAPHSRAGKKRSYFEIIWKDLKFSVDSTPAIARGPRSTSQRE